jgi:hypothetical protein
MRRIRVTAVAIGVCAIILLPTGCGSSSAHVRLVNAVPIQSNIDMLIDGNKVAGGIAYAAASSYASVSSGSRHLQIQPSGQANPFVDENITLASASYNTVLADNGAANGTLVVADNHSTPSSGNITIRVMNAASNLGTVDVYVVTAGTDIATVSPTYSNVTAPAATDYQTLSAGSYQVIFTFPSSKVILLSTTPLSFSSGQVRTVMAANGQSGGLTTSVLSDLN